MCTPLENPLCLIFFFFNDTATTEIYTLSLHDALPILMKDGASDVIQKPLENQQVSERIRQALQARSEEHTSELQSRLHLVCRLLLEKQNPPPHGVIPRGVDRVEIIAPVHGLVVHCSQL